jgi:hypothetical protein
MLPRSSVKAWALRNCEAASDFHRQTQELGATVFNDGVESF